MNRILGSIVLAATLGASGPALAATDDAAFRADSETIQELNRQHLAIVRRATQVCLGSSLGSRAGFADIGCVMRLVDGEVERSEDPQLQSFHKAIQWPDRYDQDRSAAVTQRLIEE